MEDTSELAPSQDAAGVGGRAGAPCALCSKAGCEAGCPGLGAPREDGGISSELLAEWKADQCTAVPQLVWIARALHLIDEVERLRRELRAAREAAGKGCASR